MKNAGAKHKAASVDENVITAEVDIVIDAQFLLQDLMSAHGISRAELARRAGISKARLSQLFRAEANPTLQTMARLCAAMDERITLTTATPKSAGPSQSGWDEVSWEHTSKVSKDSFLEQLYQAKKGRSTDFEHSAPCNENGYVELDLAVATA